MFRIRFRSAAALFALLPMAAALYAQTDNGSIVGYIKDPSGATVPKAKVVLRNEATGVESPTTTNDSGYYVVNSVPSGLYSLTAEAPGFKKFESLHNKLDSNSTLAIDGSLSVGNATDTVEVIADAQALQTESAAVEKLVTREQIDSLELNGRDPLFLASLQPGVRSGTTWATSRSASPTAVTPSTAPVPRTPRSLSTELPPSAPAPTAPASASRTWIPPRKCRYSPPIMALNMAAPPAVRSASSPKAAARSFMARLTNTSATQT